MPRRNNRLMGLPIIELEFEKDILHRASTGRKSAQLWEGPLPYIAKNPTRQETKNEWRIYNKATIQNKMRLDRYDAYKAK